LLPLNSLSPGGLYILITHIQHKLYIFDLGNVVLDNVDVIPAVSRELGVSQEKFSSFYDNLSDGLMIGSLSPKEFWAKYAKISGRSVERDLLETCFKPIENREMTALLSALRERGARVVCGTNTHESHFGYLKMCGIFDYFDKVYASHEMGIAKSDTEFYRSILSSENVEAEDTFFADDLIENIESAASIGIHAVLFETRDSITTDLL